MVQVELPNCDRERFRRRVSFGNQIADCDSQRRCTSALCSAVKLPRDLDMEYLLILSNANPKSEKLPFQQTQDSQHFHAFANPFPVGALFRFAASEQNRRGDRSQKSHELALSECRECYLSLRQPKYACDWVVL